MGFANAGLIPTRQISIAAFIKVRDTYARTVAGAGAAIIEAMSGAYTLTIRHGPTVVRSRHPTLDEAITALETELAALRGAARRSLIDLKVRQFEPLAQVTVRGEVSGPGRLFPAVRAGVDLRGDGSAEAYVGRVRRRLVTQQSGESAYAALRREVGQSASAPP